MNASARESRSTTDVAVVAPRRLAGYAARYGVASGDLGGFRESIAPGAFDRSLRSADGVLALYEHDRKNILGRVGAGTLRLVSNSEGLRFEIDVPDTAAGRDLLVLVARGDVAGASFAFTVPAGGDRWTQRAGQPHRELLDVSLEEITVTALPAYADTSVAVRAKGRQGTGLCLKHRVRLLAMEASL